MEEIQPSLAFPVPGALTQPRPLSGPNGVPLRATLPLSRFADVYNEELGGGGNRGARGVSQRWGGACRTEVGWWAWVTGEDVAGRADTGRAMPAGPPPVPCWLLGV